MTFVDVIVKFNVNSREFDEGGWESFTCQEKFPCQTDELNLTKQLVYRISTSDTYWTYAAESFCI